MQAKKAKKKPKVVSALAPREAVTDQLLYYATRGVFREFSATPHGTRRVDYRFVWLTSKPMHAQFDATSSVLKLVDLLPGVEPRSEMDKALRDFAAARFSAKLPPHRRLSKVLIRDLKCVNRGGNISFVLTLSRKQTGESAQQAVHFINELFQNFLAGPYHEYMVRNFDIPED